MTLDSRAWYASKTMLFNAVSLLVVAAAFIAENTTTLQLPASAATWALLVVSVGNGVLRLWTNTAITGAPADHGLGANPPR